MRFRLVINCADRDVAVKIRKRIISLKYRIEYLSVARKSPACAVEMPFLPDSVKVPSTLFTTWAPIKCIAVATSLLRLVFLN
jgi:hypothetical protein